MMERKLDVRELEPPVPLERILDMLDTLSKEDWLCVRHNREPFPLYSLLRQMDFSWDSRWSNGECFIRIWHTGHPPVTDSD
ncbi:MAG: DUF2249 domain-containing protein [Candidatus Thiodiazotropha sp.]|nr:DUF2249 domain-containing protein [Chromatiales bacterium]